MNRGDRPPKTTGSLQPIPGRCGAKLRYTDPPRYCKKFPMKGKTRCERDGGKNRTGPDNPAFRHGMRSKYGWLSPRVADSLADVMRDERLLDLTDDIALLELLKREAAGEWDMGATIEAWASLQEIAAALRTARSAPDRRALLDRLDGVLGARQPERARAALAETIERKARLVSAHQRLMAETENLIPVKRVRVVLAGIAHLVKEFIADPVAQAEFARRYVGFIGPRLHPPKEIEGETVPEAKGGKGEA